MEPASMVSGESAAIAICVGFTMVALLTLWSEEFWFNFLGKNHAVGVKKSADAHKFR
jgi:hypothetical protein